MGSITVTFLSFMFPLSSASFPPLWAPGSVHPLSVVVHYGAQHECGTRQNESDAKVKLRYVGAKHGGTRISARILLDAIGATLRGAAATAARAGACSYFGSATIASWEAGDLCSVEPGVAGQAVLSPAGTRTWCSSNTNSLSLSRRRYG